LRAITQQNTTDKDNVLRISTRNTSTNKKYWDIKSSPDGLIGLPNDWRKKKPDRQQQPVIKEQEHTHHKD
jgi:hypothetical protein